MKKVLLGSTAAMALFFGLAATAHSADVVPEPVAVTDWSGFYIGAHVGYGWANFDGCYDCDDDSSALFAEDLNVDGIVGGVHAGFNVLLDDIVLGLEADATFTDLSDSDPEPEDDEDQHGDVDLLASVRARLGVVIEEDTLVYATGGIAIPDAKWSADDAGGFERKFGEIGGVVGGGVEHALNEHFRLRAEGLYYFFGEDESIDDISDANTGEAIELKDAFVVRGGISFYLN